MDLGQLLIPAVAGLIAAVGSLGVAAMLAAALAFRNARACGRCGQALARLSADEARGVLDPGAIAEVDLGSIEWTVWRCPSCANLEREPVFVATAAFRRCPSCLNRTMSDVSEGVCRFCGASADSEAGVR